MNYGWCSSFRKDSFHLKQDQALGLWDVLQIPDTTDQFSPIVENQLDVGGNHHLFYHLHAIDGILHILHYNILNLGIIGKYQQTFVG